METFGDRLQRRRTALRLTRRQLELDAGLPSGVVSRLEAGITQWPTVPHARALARRLGVTLDWLCVMDETYEGGVE